MISLRYFPYLFFAMKKKFNGLEKISWDKHTAVLFSVIQNTACSVFWIFFFEGIACRMEAVWCWIRWVFFIVRSSNLIFRTNIKVSDRIFSSNVDVIKRLYCPSDSNLIDGYRTAPTSTACSLAQQEYKGRSPSSIPLLALYWELFYIISLQVRHSL